MRVITTDTVIPEAGDLYLVVTGGSKDQYLVSVYTSNVAGVVDQWGILVNIRDHGCKSDGLLPYLIDGDKSDKPYTGMYLEAEVSEDIVKKLFKRNMLDDPGIYFLWSVEYERVDCKEDDE
jgi:hypothetical protein